MIIRGLTNPDHRLFQANGQIGPSPTFKPEHGATSATMKVVILCGGKGTRLQDETEFRPKAMFPIGDRL
jgi:hypothetical protein